jgi:formate dehydrogenase subunit delta
MDTPHLIQMANQIGDFFEAYPNKTEAIDGIANHIKKFWEPRMRRQIYESMSQGSATDLSKLVQEALTVHEHELNATAKG